MNNFLNESFSMEKLFIEENELLCLYLSAEVAIDMIDIIYDE